MFDKIDHIAIAVRSLSAGEALMKNLGFVCKKRERVTEQGVTVAFFDVGGVHVELLEPENFDGPIGRYLGDRDAVFHHVAFASGALDADMESLCRVGLSFTSSSPGPGANGKRVAFLHPKSSLGLLFELCQEANGQRASEKG